MLDYYTNLRKTAILCFQNFRIISRKPPCWNELSVRFSNAKEPALILGHFQGSINDRVPLLLKQRD